MNWQPADITKPQKYVTVLLAILGNVYTTGHYSGEAWIGFAGNQSPPYYRIEDRLVTHWCLIEPTPAERSGR